METCRIGGAGLSTISTLEARVFGSFFQAGLSRLQERDQEGGALP